jgi:hypothetical protein
VSSLGLDRVPEASAGVLLEFEELVEQILKLGVVILEPALERGERVPVEVPGALQRLLSDCMTQLLYFIDLLFLSLFAKGGLL